LGVCHPYIFLIHRDPGNPEDDACVREKDYLLYGMV
jgi:hypothetical protein